MKEQVEVSSSSQNLELKISYKEFLETTLQDKAEGSRCQIGGQIRWFR